MFHNSSAFDSARLRRWLSAFAVPAAERNPLGHNLIPARRDCELAVPVESTEVGLPSELKDELLSQLSLTQGSNVAPQRFQQTLLTEPKITSLSETMDNSNLNFASEIEGNVRAAMFTREIHSMDPIDTDTVIVVEKRWAAPTFFYQSATWSPVLACVIWLATNGTVFAQFGGPGMGFGTGFPGYGSGYPPLNRPPYANMPYPGFASPFGPRGFSNPAWPLADGGEIVLFSEPGTNREALYTLNGMPYVMKPGTMQRLRNDRVWNLALNSGTGQLIRYTLPSGAYKFKPTGFGISMGLFATQDWPGISSDAAPTAPVPNPPGLNPSAPTVPAPTLPAPTVPAPTVPAPSGPQAPSTRNPTTFTIPPSPLSEYSANRPAYQNPVRRFDESPAPTITASRWFNTSYALSSEQLRGRVVLLDFWGNWCGPCVRNLPKVQALYDKYKDRGLIVIGVHSAQGSDRAAGFLAKYPYSFPIALDTGDTARRYGVERWPSYVLIDKSGQQRMGLAHEPPRDDLIENLLK